MNKTILKSARKNLEAFFYEVQQDKEINGENFRREPANYEYLNVVEETGCSKEEAIEAVNYLLRRDDKFKKLPQY